MAELDTSQKGGKHKGKGGKRAKKMSTRVDLTPMVDLGFLLVTFFMLTTTFSKPSTMEIKWPPKDDKTEKQKESPQVATSKSINIILDSNSVYWYSGMFSKNTKVEDIKEVEYAEGIREVLFREKKIRNNDIFVFIKALDAATYGRVVDMLDEINICEINKGNVFLVEPTDGEKELLKQRNK